MIDTGGGSGDVEVLAYVNSNLIVIHEPPKSSSSSSSIPPPEVPPVISAQTADNPSAAAEKIVPSLKLSATESQTRKTETTVPKNLKSSSVTVINEAVLKNRTSSLPESSSKSRQKVTKKAISDPVVANFTVDGWPISKSRMAPNYVNYDEESATLVPKIPFTSSLASKYYDFILF